MYIFKSFAKDKRAVSPVIGVMLMIVVTVILAAAVGAFSGSITTKEDIPSATFKASASISEQNITIEHLGGDPIYKDFVKFEISSGRPKMSSYVDNSNVTFYPPRAEGKPDLLGPGKIAKISFEINDNVVGYENGNIAGQIIGTGVPFTLTIVDRETDMAIYSTNIVMGP